MKETLQSNQQLRQNPDLWAKVAGACLAIAAANAEVMLDGGLPGDYLDFLAQEAPTVRPP